MRNNPFELPKESLHEVIMRTIEIDNISNKIIRASFGLDLKFSENNNPLNLERIFRFNKFFLGNFGSNSRAELLLNIVNEINRYNKENIKLCNDFKNKLITFYEIRNIFAHNIYPKDLKGITRLESNIPYWIDLNKQHLMLYSELKESLNNLSSIKQIEV